MCMIDWSPFGTCNCRDCAVDLFRLAAENLGTQRNAPDLPEVEYARIDIDDEMHLYVKLFAEDRTTVVVIYRVIKGNRVRLYWAMTGEAAATSIGART
jgi:hypothetical protein